VSPTAAELARARRATRTLFLSLGLLSGAWGAHVPSVRSHYALGEGLLSVVLLAGAVGAVSALFFAGRVVGRWGARRAAALSSLLLCLSLGLVLEYPGLWTLLPAMVVFGASMSLFDVAINTEGSELESAGGRAIMSNLHGMFSVGGMAGAALVSVLLAQGVAPSHQLWVLCALLALASAWASRGMLAVHAGAAGADHAAGEGSHAHFAWPRGLLLVIGLLIFAGMTAEGVMYDWCVLYLKQDVGLSQATAALGYAAFAGAMALSRFAGDTLRERFSEQALLRSGGSLAALSMAVVLLSADARVALLGFALAGAGLAPVAPILFNAATRVPGVSRAAAIASVTSVGYSGFLVGPPLIGSIASLSSLSAALSVVVLSAVLLALGASRVPKKPG
jgi:predicted MFS family arabinose efflux permease